MTSRLHLPLLFLLSLIACAGDNGGQTGSELVCQADVDCLDALGPGYACGDIGECEESLPGTDVCRGNEDCTGAEEVCFGPNQPRGCGIPPQEECDDNSDCDVSLVCHAVSDPCSLDGIGSRCQPACQAGECEQGFRCNGDGACEPVPCDEGNACASHRSCAPNAASDLVHEWSQGCEIVSCTDDTACASGILCVNEQCQQSLGTCELDLPVP